MGVVVGVVVVGAVVDVSTVVVVDAVVVVSTVVVVDAVVEVSLIAFGSAVVVVGWDFGDRCGFFVARRSAATLVAATRLSEITAAQMQATKRRESPVEWTSPREERVRICYPEQSGRSPGTVSASRAKDLSQPTDPGRVGGPQAARALALGSGSTCRRTTRRTRRSPISRCGR